MKMKWMLLSLAAAMCLAMAACGGNTASEEDASGGDADSAPIEVTEGETEEEPEPTNAPFTEPDPNSVTFDDGNFAFAEIVTDDDQSCSGTLSVETIDNNAMLKYTNDPGTLTTENMDVMVQKVKIHASQLLSPDQLDCVYSIGFDMYAEADTADFVNDNGENVQVPGWIGGGGGTETVDGKWYSFADFSGSGINEYNLQRSDACRVEFKFLLASAGKKWDSTMEDANFLIMRWGIQNISSMYIDNITFYDEEGNSIPLNPSTPSAEAEPEAEETAAEAE